MKTLWNKLFGRHKSVALEHEERQVTRLQEWNDRLELRAKERERELDEIRDEKVVLNEELETLKLKKKIEEEDIEHMVTMKMEKAELDTDRKIMEVDKEKSEAIAAVKSEYQDKLHEIMEEQVRAGEERYAQILSRLPDVTAKLKL